MKIAILGYGDQGKSAYDYWNKPENQIVICDQSEKIEVPGNVTTKLGNDYLRGLAEFDLIVRSPSVHPSDIAEANSPEILEKVTTNTNEFLRVCPSKNIIGVTGTKGKGTTSTLIAKMLEATGKTVHLGGNIGIPPLEMLHPPSAKGGGIQPDDWVVLELANFQLIDLKHSPHIAVCLMVVAEHLDWHGDTQEYIVAKQQLFAHQSADDIAIYYAHNSYSQHIASVSRGHKVPYMKHPGADVIENSVVVDGQKICSVDELKLLGKHNWQNVCAAVTTVWQITQNIEAIRSVLTSFSGLEHRLEFVREFNGIKYYDDSFGTTPETAIVAIQAFNQPKVVILGGSDKGASYDELIKTALENNVRHVVAIGNTAEKITDTINKYDHHQLGRLPLGWTLLGKDTNIQEIVDSARDQAQPGDIVLLSPACASFGLFKNYKHRGEEFKKAVLALQ